MATTTTHSLSMLFADLREGVPGSRNALLAALQQNLTRLTAAILRDFPIVERKRQVDSLLQDLNGKLLGAMDDGVRPENVTEFIKFSAFRLRQMLRDEAAKMRRRGVAVPLADPNLSGMHGAPDPSAGDDSASVLLQWDDFQTKVQQLSDEELLVFDLHFHMQMPQSDVADLLAIPAKTISRTWLSAAKKLKDVIPKIGTPKRVVLVSGGEHFLKGEATKLFAGWRAIQLRAVGHAESNLILPAAQLDWADVICVTRPSYAEAVRRSPGLAGKKVVCLDLTDDFDPLDKTQVNLLWERLTKRIGD